jgi:hypothetical protein
MQFSFRDAPGWFNDYIVDEFLDEFHEHAHQAGAIKWIDEKTLKQCLRLKHQRNNDKLLDFAIEFFTAKGLCVRKQDRQVWFDIDETNPKYFWLILKWSD